MNEPRNPITDSERDANREELRKRLNVVDDPCFTEANEFLDRTRMVERMTGHQSSRESLAHDAFITGWRHASQRSHGSLFDENQKLREALDDAVLRKFRADHGEAEPNPCLDACRYVLSALKAGDGALEIKDYNERWAAHLVQILECSIAQAELAEEAAAYKANSEGASQ